MGVGLKKVLEQDIDSRVQSRQICASHFAMAGGPTPLALSRTQKDHVGPEGSRGISLGPRGRTGDRLPVVGLACAEAGVPKAVHGAERLSASH